MKRELGVLMAAIGVIAILVALVVKPGEQLAYKAVPFQTEVEDKIRKAGLPYIVEKAESKKLENVRREALKNARQKGTTLGSPVSLGELLLDNLPPSGKIIVIYKTFMKPEAGTSPPYDQPRDTYWRIVGPSGEVLVRHHQVYATPPSPLRYSVETAYESVSIEDKEVTFRYVSWHSLAMGLLSVVILIAGLLLFFLPFSSNSSRQPSAQPQSPSG